MIDIRRWILKYIFSSMVFVIFMVILSPVYVHRTVILKLTYSSAAQTSVSIECLRNKADYHRKSPVEPERFVLPQSESPNTVFLELPADNRIGGLLFSVLENASVFRFMDAAILCRGKSHPLPPDRFFVSPRDRHQVRLENGIMQIKPGRKISIPFFLSEKLKVRRSIDFVAALYMAVLSLIPALLVFRKTEITLNRRNAFDLLYVSAAVFFLIFPVLLIDYYGIFSSEQRLQNKFPSVFQHQTFNIDFPKQFEAWLTDRFTGRKQAIKQERQIFSFDFDPFSGKDVILGEDHWMFYKGWNAVDMYQNKNRFSDVQLETCAGNVTRLNDHFRKKGIRLYLLLSPDKERIYSEYYPKSYKQVHPESRLEQLSGCFEKKTPVKTVSLLGPLRDLKKEHPVFFKTGSHWTSRAAHAGVARLLQEIRKDYPDLPSEQPNAEQWIHDLCADVDIAYVAGYTEPEKQLPASDLLYDRPRVLFSYDEQRIEGGCLGECKLTEYTAVKPAPGSLRIFVCSDSFWAYAVPFMFPAANTMLHASFSNGADFDLDLIREQIDSFHPDIVVIESAERFLERFLNIGMEGE